MNTSTRIDETFQKQYPIALVAIAEHITEHQLRAPLDIQADADLGLISILLPGLSSHADWLNTVHVDSEDSEYRTPPPGMLEPYLRTRWTVRLPASGIKVELSGLRPLPLSVVAPVPAASA